MTTSIGKTIFGFLNLILQRKKKLVEEFLINPSDKQLDGKSYLNDDDIEPMVEDTVREAVSQIGDEYKNFLIKHYFRNRKKYADIHYRRLLCRFRQ